MKFSKNMRISHKISALMIGLIISFIVIGVTYYIQITVEDNARVAEQNALGFRARLAETNFQFTRLLIEGRQVIENPRDETVTQHQQDIDLFREQLQGLLTLANDSEQNNAQQTELSTNIINQFDQYLLVFERVTSAQQRLGFSADVGNSISDLVSELANSERALGNLFASALASDFRSGLEVEQTNATQRQIVQAAVTAIIFAVAMGTAVGVYFLYKSIVFPMVHIQSVIHKINRGKTGARVKVINGDELGDLGTAFNQLLDERINRLEEGSQENERLNNSIISLIKAVGMIAQRDLTVKVPVSPDITGTVSDAVNLLTTETAKTLQEVRSISQEVNAVSDNLQEQSGLVIQFADGEKRQIIAAAKALEILAKAMNEVASHAETADQSATRAIENTQQARHSVEETVAGIRTIRETISETEKRTKRLGDRSQEISGIVNLINTIAERTHILALNASMHAASAGEAGRGFAVVADEVQRLAESARQSTDEIAAMVNNMRVETSDTVAIMNTLIAQVADGSRLAEEAGKRMADTEGATQALVEEVKHIAKQATQQAEVANRVRDQSSVIREYTDKTGAQLEQQKIQTDSLKRFADNLVRQVNVFTLPAMEARRINVAEAAANIELESNQGLDDQELDNQELNNAGPLHAAS